MTTGKSTHNANLHPVAQMFRLRGQKIQKYFRFPQFAVCCANVSFEVTKNTKIQQIPTICSLLHECFISGDKKSKNASDSHNLQFVAQVFHLRGQKIKKYFRFPQFAVCCANVSFEGTKNQKILQIPTICGLLRKCFVWGDKKSKNTSDSHNLQFVAQVFRLSGHSGEAVKCARCHARFNSRLMNATDISMYLNVSVYCIQPYIYIFQSPTCKAFLY